MPKRDKVCQKILTRWKREINLVVKEGCQIWKDKYVFLFVCLLLTGWASDKTKPSAENRKNLTIDINKIQLPIEQDCSLGSYFVDGDVVYYSVYMPVGDYEENPDAEFDVSMETEIQSFKRWRNRTSESRAGFFWVDVPQGRNIVHEKWKWDICDLDRVKVRSRPELTDFHNMNIACYTVLDK